MYKILITLSAIILSLSFSLLSQELEKATITEALTDLSVDRDAVKKLIITGEISGSDYSEGSEWRLFRTLDETFPNIEEIELHTKQDIPNYQQIDVPDGIEYRSGYIGLFCKYYTSGNYYEGLWYPSLWLKKFSAPNIKRVGNVNFYRCENLTEINIPAAEIIGMGAFDYCKKLALINISSAKTIEHAAFSRCAITHINCFQVEEIEWLAFAGCTNLVYVNFNIDISEQTTINFGDAVFGGTAIDIVPVLQIILPPILN